MSYKNRKRRRRYKDTRFTTRRGRRVGTSGRQDAWLHARLGEGDDRGDHTHINPDGSRTRFTVKHPEGVKE